jgi:hypothetical protein
VRSAAGGTTSRRWRDTPCTRDHSVVPRDRSLDRPTRCLLGGRHCTLHRRPACPTCARPSQPSPTAWPRPARPTAPTR